MLYRPALIRYGDKWIVQRVLYARIQSDRKTTAVFVREHIGPEFKSLTKACQHLQAVDNMLNRIAFQDQIINDPNEDKQIKAQSEAARKSLIADLIKLTGHVP